MTARKPAGRALGQCSSERADVQQRGGEAASRRREEEWEIRSGSKEVACSLTSRMHGGAHTQKSTVRSQSVPPLLQLAASLSTGFTGTFLHCRQTGLGTTVLPAAMAAEVRSWSRPSSPHQQGSAVQLQQQQQHAYSPASAQDYTHAVSPPIRSTTSPLMPVSAAQTCRQSVRRLVPQHPAHHPSVGALPMPTSADGTVRQSYRQLQSQLRYRGVSTRSGHSVSYTHLTLPTKRIV